MADDRRVWSIRVCVCGFPLGAAVAVLRLKTCPDCGVDVVPIEERTRRVTVYAEPEEGVYQYRLRFETVTGLPAADVDALSRGGGVSWPRVPRPSDETWEGLPWREAERISSGDDDIFDQYRVLARWAEAREQPIRNVRLDRRRLPDPEALRAWQRVGNDELESRARDRGATEPEGFTESDTADAREDMERERAAGGERWWLVASFGPGAGVIDACWVEAATDSEAAEVGRADLKAENDGAGGDPDYAEAVAVIDASAPRWFEFEAKAVPTELQCCGGHRAANGVAVHTGHCPLKDELKPGDKAS